MKLARIIGFSTSAAVWLGLASNVVAQEASDSSKGGLPAAGVADWTYILFIGGIFLFVLGTIKIVGSFRDSN